MYGLQMREPRFSLYYLDEGEMYIKEFVGTCQFVYPENNKVENLNGIIHLCSRSIAFEPDDHTFSIVKFPFRNITIKPKILSFNNKDLIKLVVNKLVEVPKGQTVQANQVHNLSTDVVIEVLFESIEIVFGIIIELIEKYSSKSSSFEFDSEDFLGNLYTFKFDYTRIKSINEQNLIKQEVFVKKIVPLIEVPGLLMMTDLRIYFQPLFSLNNKRSYSVKYTNIEKLYKRKLKLRELGIEICTLSHKDYLFQFENESMRDSVFEIILKNCSKDCETNFSIEKYMKLWIDGSISNYDYLIALNSAANRTRNGLSQYPVFPWIISNFEADKLDLKNPKNFRDLSKPIGALDDNRFSNFKERYNQMPEPKFLYGVHYSNPAYVIDYLVRKHPEYMIKLHGGRFDHPDRIFSCIATDWKVCLTNPGSLKELIPEFYEENTEFLLNRQNLDLGKSSIHGKINHVKLPNWASDPIDFLKKMKEALECEYVSQNLHNWIDLIFGYKQRGKASIEANNVFHPVTYDGGQQMMKGLDQIEIKALETQISEFGQTPKLLFTSPHPKRYSNKLSDLNNLNILLKNEISNNRSSENSLEVEERLKKAVKDEKISLKDLLRKAEGDEKEVDVKSDFIGFEEEKPIKKYSFDFEKREFRICLEGYHKQKVTSFCFQNDSNSIISTSLDGYIKIFDCKIKRTKKWFNISQEGLTCSTCLSSNSLLAIGSEDTTIHIFNTQHGKEINTILAHEEPVVNVFYSEIDNKLISASEDSTYKIWNLTNFTKIPYQIFYDTESKIMSADYRKQDGMFACIDSDGIFVLRNLMKTKDVKIKKMEIDKFNFVKFNEANINQIFFSSQKSFKIFDVRNLSHEAESLTQLVNSTDLINDSNEFFFSNDTKTSIYRQEDIHSGRDGEETEVKEKGLIKTWPNFTDICKISSNSINQANPEIIALGNSKGDVFISSLIDS